MEISTSLGATATELTAVADQMADLSGALAALGGDLGATETSLESLGAEVASGREDLEASAAANAAGIVSLAEDASARLSSLEKGLMAISTDLGDVQIEVADISTVITMPVTLADAFERRLVMMQAWQEILKARLHLLERNAGLAVQSLALVQANVAKFAALSTDLSEEQLAPILERVDAAAALVEEDPLQAILELEIVWHNLEKLVAAPIGEEPAAEGATVIEVTTGEGEAPAEEETVAPEEGGGTEDSTGGGESSEGGESSGSGG